jgi:hypothetical protein
MLREKSHAAICCITAARRGKFTQTRAERERERERVYARGAPGLIFFCALAAFRSLSLAGRQVLHYSTPPCLRKCNKMRSAEEKRPTPLIMWDALLDVKRDKLM